MLDKLLEEFNSKGWNLYKVSMEETINDCIPKGPVSKLEKGGIYVLHPKTENPKNIDEVMKLTDYMVQVKKYPLIRLGGATIALPLFNLKESEVMIGSNLDLNLSYEEFHKALESLTSFMNN
jgi:hypothetical protein